MMHLARYLHDVTNNITEIWCNADRWTHNATDDVDLATCPDCFEAAIEYGNEVMRRWAQVLRDEATAHGVKLP